MKYIFITLSPSEGNLTLFLRNLGTGFKEQGYQPVFIFDRKKIPDNLPEDTIAYSWPSYRPVKWADFTFLYRLIKKYRPQIIMPSFGAVNVSLIVSALLRVPVRMVWYHTKSNQIKLDSKRTKLVQQLLRWRRTTIVRLFANYVISNSKSTAQDAVSYLGINPRKIVVVDFLLPLMNRKAVKTEENQILCVGRLHRSKGQAYLISAIPLIVDKYPDARFVFLGDGPMRKELEDQALDLGVDRYCVFKGSVPLTEVYDELERSKIHISASMDEAFGLVNVEALSMGVVVLGPNVGGVAEIIEDDINGYFIDIHNPADIFEKIDRVLGDDKRYRTLSDNALKTFENKYAMTESNMKTMVQKILTFIS